MKLYALLVVLLLVGCSKSATVATEPLQPCSTEGGVHYDVPCIESSSTLTVTHTVGTPGTAEAGAIEPKPGYDLMGYPKTEVRKTYLPRWTDSNCMFHYETDAPFPLVRNPKCKTVDERVQKLEQRIHELEGTGLPLVAVDPNKDFQYLKMDKEGRLMVTVEPSGGMGVTIAMPSNQELLCNHHTSDGSFFYPCWKSLFPKSVPPDNPAPTIGVSSEVSIDQ